jgi:hypothetical protein
MAYASSVSSLLDLCLGTVAASVTNRASLADMLPRELMAKLDREARRCAGCAGPYYGSGFAHRRFPHRLAEQDVVLESVYCSSRCASTQQTTAMAAYTTAVQSPLRPYLPRGSESMEDLAT